MERFTISGNVVDVFNREIFKGQIEIVDAKIYSITRVKSCPDIYILPGLIDSHVHVESSMLTPSRFARLVVPRGTIGVVSDPHEIANVLGEEGVRFMIEDGKTTPFKFFFGAPSCVPATSFESTGGVLDGAAIELLLNHEDIYFLSEMMNFPGVIEDNLEVIKKIEAAKRLKLKIDGHAPGLTATRLKKYVGAGIDTDHECFSLDEALEKISMGMKIQIREGSAARNFKNLAPLLQSHPGHVMLCTDDSHPDEILKHGHIDRLIKIGLGMGIDIFNLLRAASVNPVIHYNLPVGLLRPGDPADFIVVDSLGNFHVQQTYINGCRVFDQEAGISFPLSPVTVINKFGTGTITINELKVCMPPGKSQVKVIEVEDGQLVTKQLAWIPLLTRDREVRSDIPRDILKLVVLNRYSTVPPAIAFVKNMGLKTGALASTVAHDSHNIIAVGTDDESLLKAINKLVEIKGGIVAVNNNEVDIVELPVAGLMSVETGEIVARQYEHINRVASKLGSTLKAPFMTLSFLSLLVIPTLKLSDKGLFDVNTFTFTTLFD